MEERVTVAMIDNALSKVSDDKTNEVFNDMFDRTKIDGEIIEVHVGNECHDNSANYINEYEFYVAVAYENDEFRYFLIDEDYNLLSKSSVNIDDLQSEIEERYYNKFGQDGYFNIYEAKINDSLELDMLKVQFGDKLPKNHFVVCHSRKEYFDEGEKEACFLDSKCEYFWTKFNDSDTLACKLYRYEYESEYKTFKYQLKDTDVSLEKLLRTDVKKIDSVLDLKQEQKFELKNDVDEDEKPKRRSRNRLR
ncbi:hypothetical protein KS670_003362 [Vibrio parahaemolyticus]|uniref:hypothetical protein n=1 Tax=Vibrio sp. B183 TaxID=1526762 RepID=UPI00050661A3|nr:hypothetical protein [Vibrio sp. B183]EHR0227802.1 hypothetical protein [Vibrio parahaemolyticus]KFI12680.1 hypothetical protein IX95_06925 [Vibrio sp. B183]